MKKLWGCILLSTLLMTGCVPERVDSGKKLVTVSILPLKYFVDRIGGGDFDVVVLVPPGAGPETYEPLPSQMKEIALADAYFHFGLIGFERALHDWVVAKHPELKAVELSQGMEMLNGDPHVWMSPRRMGPAAREIFSTLERIYPDSTGKYSSNLDKLLDDISMLDDHIRAVLDTIPQRQFVVNHPFLTYYADDYGLEQISLEHNGKEPSAGHLTDVMERIEQNGITSLMYQKGTGGEGAAAVAEKMGMTTEEADPLEYEWLKGMYDITYTISLMLHE